MTGRTITSTTVSSTPPTVALKPGFESSPNGAELVPVQLTMSIGQAGVLAKILAGFDADVASERIWPPEGYDPELWHDVVVELLTVAGRVHLADLEAQADIERTGARL